MGRDELSRIGSADEAQTPPASVPPFSSDAHRSYPLFQQEAVPLFERSGAASGPVTGFDWSVLNAAAMEPLLAEATALLHRAFPAPPAGSSEPLPADEEVAGAEVAIAKLLRAVELSRHAALHDPLTGLANRSLILDHLKLALARTDRRTVLVAVVFVDIDDFKRINDTLGHVAGDELLARVAERLHSAVRPTDTLGRWGGDEFIVVCEDLERASDAPAIVDRVAAAFEAPFAVAGTELHVAASIGVAVSACADQPATLIHAADSAMYQAKRAQPTRLRPGPDPVVFRLPAGGALPRHERVIRPLLALLSSLEVDDPAPPAEADLAALVSS
jgi:diguanylate cyclase (GGDEF)-like protein